MKSTESLKSDLLKSNDNLKNALLDTQQQGFTQLQQTLRNNRDAADKIAARLETGAHVLHNRPFVGMHLDGGNEQVQRLIGTQSKKGVFPRNINPEVRTAAPNTTHTPPPVATDQRRQQPQHHSDQRQQPPQNNDRSRERRAPIQRVQRGTTILGPQSSAIIAEDDHTFLGCLTRDTLLCPICIARVSSDDALAIQSSIALIDSKDVFDRFTYENELQDLDDPSTNVPQLISEFNASVYNERIAHINSIYILFEPCMDTA